MSTLAELKSATNNFRPDTVIGEGGFGTVYKGWIDEKKFAPSNVGVGMPVAVKKSNPDSEQGHKEWQDYNAKLSDFGLAKLGPVNGDSHVTTRVVGTYGYAAPEYRATGHLYVRGTHVLHSGQESDNKESKVAEYLSFDLAGGTRAANNPDSSMSLREMSSGTRLNVVSGVAAAIYNSKYLKAAQDLLDEVVNVHEALKQSDRLRNFNLLRQDRAEEADLKSSCSATGISGDHNNSTDRRRVLDLNKPNGEHNLVDWASEMLLDKKKLRKLMDHRWKEKVYLVQRRSKHSDFTNISFDLVFNFITNSSSFLHNFNNPLILFLFQLSIIQYLFHETECRLAPLQTAPPPTAIPYSTSNSYNLSFFLDRLTTN